MSIMKRKCRPQPNVRITDGGSTGWVLETVKRRLAEGARSRCENGRETMLKFLATPCLVRAYLKGVNAYIRGGFRVGGTGQPYISMQWWGYDDAHSGFFPTTRGAYGRGG